MELNGIFCIRGSATFPLLRVHKLPPTNQYLLRSFTWLSTRILMRHSCLQNGGLPDFARFTISFAWSCENQSTAGQPLTKSMSSYLFSYFFPLALPNVLLPFSVIFSVGDFSGVCQQSAGHQWLHLQPDKQDVEHLK